MATLCTGVLEMPSQEITQLKPLSWEIGEQMSGEIDAQSSVTHKRERILPSGLQI